MDQTPRDITANKATGKDFQKEEKIKIYYYPIKTPPFLLDIALVESI